MAEIKKAPRGDSIKRTDKDTEKLAFQRLKDEYLKENIRKYPSIPPQCRCIPNFSDKNSNELTKSILAWFKLKGHQCERVNVFGRAIDRRRIVHDCIGRPRQIGSLEWIPSGSQRGSADIHAVVNSIAIKVEVKTGKDRQSEHQKAYEAQVIAAGGKYWLVRSFSQFLDLYDEFVTNNHSENGNA